jgi:hypothetical protein
MVANFHGNLNDDCRTEQEHSRDSDRFERRLDRTAQQNQRIGLHGHLLLVFELLT